jgi:hypothetical protein
MAQATIKGRAVGAGTGDPQDLNGTQATAILDNVVGDTGTGGTKGLVPAPAAGDAAAGKFLKADGTFAVPPGTGTYTDEQAQDAIGAMLADTATIDLTYTDATPELKADVKDGSITYAKIQDVSATSRVIGRKTAGAGAAEELTLSEVLDFIASAAQGDVLYRGASAWSRLAAGTSGYFLKTNGASANPTWDNVGSAASSQGSTSGPIFPFTPPVDGDFAWVNQGGASVATDGVGIYLLGPAASGINLRIRKKSAPGTPYTITAGFVLNGPGTACGLCWRQSSDGKLILFEYFANALIIAKYTNETTFSANYLNNSASNLVGTCLWFRMTDNGINRICSVSMDGFHFIQVHSVGRTDFLTADEIGFWVNATTSFNVGMTLLSWQET